MKNLEQKVVVDWIKPFGTIFINLLKMIAVPLIVVSLIVGLADLKDISKLSKLGENGTILFMFYRSSGHYWFRVSQSNKARKIY
jgi:Na+/H+-dicarboxylate symporter